MKISLIDGTRISLLLSRQFIAKFRACGMTTGFLVFASRASCLLSTSLSLTSVSTMLLASETAFLVNPQNTHIQFAVQEPFAAGIDHATYECWATLRLATVTSLRHIDIRSGRPDTVTSSAASWCL